MKNHYISRSFTSGAVLASVLLAGCSVSGNKPTPVVSQKNHGATPAATAASESANVDRNAELHRLRLDLAAMAMADMDVQEQAQITGSADWVVTQGGGSDYAEFSRSSLHVNNITADFSLLQQGDGGINSDNTIPKLEKISSITYSLLPSDQKDNFYSINVRFDELTKQPQANVGCSYDSRDGNVSLNEGDPYSKQITDEEFTASIAQAKSVAQAIFSGSVVAIDKPIVCS